MITTRIAAYSPLVTLTATPAQVIRLTGWLAAGLAALATGLPAAANQQLTTGLFSLAIVQLAISRMIPRTDGAVAAWLLSAGTLAYAAGFFGPAAWLTSAATLAVLSGIARVWLEPVADGNGHERRILAGLIFAGVALDGLLALSTLTPGSALTLYLGPAGGLRFRLLALARVAAITLPALALLYQQAVRRRILSAPSISWVCLALHAGAVLMPSILILAAIVNPLWKYVLPIPALLVFVGACGAARFAQRRGRRLEHLGWVLMAASMAAGLAMGLYAFDGPLPSPNWIGAYGDAARSFLRHTHGLAIVAGILLVFFARERRAPFRGDHS